MQRILIYGILFLTFLISSTPTILAQQWIRTYDGSSHLDDVINATVTDKQGNIYITGYTTSSSSGADIITKKYDASGVEQWSRTYNGPGNSDDRAFGIVVDRDGNIIITGYSTGVGSGKDFATIKYSSSGTFLWVSSYNEPGNGDDRAFGIVVDRIGNIYVTGYIARIGTDVYTIKYNPSGVQVWGHLINGTANSDDGAFGIVVDSIGNNIFICGYLDNDTTGIDFMVANYDSTGNRRWLRSINGQGESEDKAFGIVVDAEDFVIGSGYTTDSIQGTNIFTAKLNFSGDQLWVRSYNGTGGASDRAFGIVVDADGNSFVSGYSYGLESGTDYIAVKYTPAGDTDWTARYNGTGNFHDTAKAMYLSGNGQFLYLTGSSSSDTGVGKLDAVSVKFDTENGEVLQWVKYNGAANKNDFGTGITADTNKHIFVAGYSETLNNGLDMFVMKYVNGELISVEQISSNVPQSFSLYQNYPNPFNPVTRILFDVNKAARIKLAIYDILGREVKVLVNEDLSAGTYESVFTSDKLASGIYFYELSSLDFRQTKRMILVK